MIKAIKILLVLFFLMLFILEVVITKHQTSAIGYIVCGVKAITSFIIAMVIANTVDKEIDNE